MAMTLASVIDFARMRVGDVDPVAYRYTFTEWLDAVETARLILSSRLVGNFSAMVVTPSGITPTLTDEEGVLLALRTAKVVLDVTYSGRLDTGSLGVSWSSGLESESTISQEKAYRTAVTTLDIEVEEHLLIFRRASTGARVQ